MIDHTGSSATPKMTARISGGESTFRAEGTWSRGRIYGAIKRWIGAEPELGHKRREHTFVLTLSGGTDLTGTRISGSPLYEGQDAAGCVTFVPSNAERRGWYRNADMGFFVLLVDPEFEGLFDFGRDAQNLQPFTNRRDRVLESVLWSLASEMRDRAARPLALYAEHAAGLLLSHVMLQSRGRAVSGRVLSEAGLRLVLDFVEANLHRDISLSDLAALVGMGADVFARHFKLHVGTAPYRYVLDRRIRRAQDLLQANKKSIAEIALAVGFSSQSHFTTQFSKLLHLTPAPYRSIHRA